MFRKYLNQIKKHTIKTFSIKTRKEKDSMGQIDVPEDRYWGAQTQRSL